MRGGFDLYGTYYPNANDALNAEMAQRNEIDNRSNSKKLSEQDKTIKKLLHKIELLELELNKLKNDNGNSF